MNTPPPIPPESHQPHVADDMQIQDWLRLRRELTELHARLEYLRLMVSLGVGETRN
jgi:hypothetical protein